MLWLQASTGGTQAATGIHSALLMQEAESCNENSECRRAPSSLLALAALLAVYARRACPVRSTGIMATAIGQSRQWHGGRWYQGAADTTTIPGAVIGGVLLGLGVGALLGGALVAPPPVVYAPPPRYANPYAPPPPIYYGY